MPILACEHVAGDHAREQGEAGDAGEAEHHERCGGSGGVDPSTEQGVRGRRGLRLHDQGEHEWPDEADERREPWEQLGGKLGHLDPVYGPYVRSAATTAWLRRGDLRGGGRHVGVRTSSVRLPEATSSSLVTPVSAMNSDS